MARKPKGAGAVMADHAPAVVEADDPRTALYRKLNYFPTPPWAARAGAELILRVDPGVGDGGSVWEPACGEGHMAHALAGYFSTVIATDIHAHGWVGQRRVVDFISPEADDIGAEWIVSNPPFAMAQQFVEVGLRRARRGVAMLCRAAWLETEGRYGMFFGEAPLSVYAPFFDRVSMQLGGWDPKGHFATAYAWFVWMKPQVGEAASAPVVMPIPPGTKARLTRPDDARLFGARAAMPLFEGAG